MKRQDRLCASHAEVEEPGHPTQNLEVKPSHLAYGFVVSFLATIFVLRWWQRPAYPQGLWILLTVMASGLCVLLHTRIRSAATICIVAILGIAIALLSVSRTTHVSTSDDVEAYAGRGIALEGIVCNHPDARATYTYYAVCVHRVTVEDAESDVTGTVLLKHKENGAAQFAYGDEIRTLGTLGRPPHIPGFDYAAYLSLSNIYGIFYPSQSEVLETDRGNPVLAELFSFKDRFEGRIERLFPEPEASFLEGLLTGSRRGLPSDLMDDFNAAGLTHIIAISGYNITIVLAVMQSLLFWLPLRWRFVPSVLAIAAFTLVTGGSASAVRAAVMGFLGLLAVQLGRSNDIRLSILWTLFLMLAWNPKQLWFDASFQLSFLSVIGITELQPLLAALLSRVPNVLGVRDNLQVTLSAQCATTPWIVLLFGRMSLIAPLSNLAVIPLMPHAMLLGFAAMVANVPVVTTMATSLLSTIIGMIRMFAAVPGASVPMSATPAWTSAWYALLACVVIARKLTIRRASPASASPAPARTPLSREHVRGDERCAR